MALTVTAPSRAYSIGPVKQALFTYTTAGGETSGSFTAPFFDTITAVLVDGGLQQTAPYTVSGQTITLTLTAVPTGGTVGTIMVHGT